MTDKEPVPAEIPAESSEVKVKIEPTEKEQEDFDKKAEDLINAIAQDDSSDDEELSVLEKEAAQREMAAITSASGINTSSAPRPEEPVVEQVGLVMKEEIVDGEEETEKMEPPESQSSSQLTEAEEKHVGENRKPFWDFALENLLVGVATLTIEGDEAYCSSCQKELELSNLRIHLEGDGHKLNTLWNYDKSLAEVTAELRHYPKKFEMEMFKHIVMLNKIEKRYNISWKVEKAIRDLFRPATPGRIEHEEELRRQEQQKKKELQPEMNPEEIAELKAGFIASFINPVESTLVHQAMMDDLGTFDSPNNAVTSLKLAVRLGKDIAAYQKDHFEEGYEVNLECIKEIKDQCAKLLKIIDEYKLGPTVPR